MKHIFPAHISLPNDMGNRIRTEALKRNISPSRFVYHAMQVAFNLIDAHRLKSIHDSYSCSVTQLVEGPSCPNFLGEAELFGEGEFAVSVEFDPAEHASAITELKRDKRRTIDD